MALFGKKTEKAVDQKIEEKQKKASRPAKAPGAMSLASVSSFRTDVIIRPRITEKSGVLSQSGMYTFEVAKNANKAMISGAVSSLFKVTPVRVAIINLPAKKVILRGRKGVVSGVRKAVVTLKKGDKIDFV